MDKLNIKLGIIAGFANDAVIIKRVINHKLL